MVLAGSTALKRESESIPPSVKDARKALIEAGILVSTGDVDLYTFSQDVSFGSPSGASAAVAGRADNGRTTWRVESSGQPYAAWRSGLIDNNST